MRKPRVRYSVEFWEDDTGRTEVPVGDDGALMPACTKLTVERADDHSIELVVGVEDGRPVVETVTIVRNPAATPITHADLRRVPLGDLLAEAVRLSLLGPHVDSRDDAEVFELASDDAVAAFTRAGRRRRNEVTPARLRKVASALDDAERSGATIADVAVGLHISVSQLYRLRARALAEIDPATGEHYLKGDQS